MFASVPTQFLESVKPGEWNKSDSNEAKGAIVEVNAPSKKPAKKAPLSKRLKEMKKQLEGEDRVIDITSQERNELIGMLINNNKRNAQFNLKSQSNQVLISNEHIDTENCQIL